jgi:hypothetical protein
MSAYLLSALFLFGSVAFAGPLPVGGESGSGVTSGVPAVTEAVIPSVPNNGDLVIYSMSFEAQKVDNSKFRCAEGEDQSACLKDQVIPAMTIELKQAKDGSIYIVRATADAVTTVYESKEPMTCTKAKQFCENADGSKYIELFYLSVFQGQPGALYLTTAETVSGQLTTSTLPLQQ